MTAQVEIPGYLAGTWDIDATHTEVGFVVRHLVVTKVRGRFSEVTGSITTTENPLEASVDISVGVNSITTHNEARDAHLRSPDFFDAENHPDMTYQATGARPDGENFVLDGELSLNGVTRTVPLTIELGGFSADPWGGTRLGASGTAQINRKDFNVNFEGVQNGIVMVSDKIDIHIEVEAVLRKPETA